MRALVTGHRGFIGHHLVQMLEDRGHRVMGLDKKDGHDIRTCILPREIDVDHVFHLAAHVDAQSEDAWADVSNNVLSALRIFKKYRDKVIFTSSAAVNYPVTPYAIGKRACEDYAKLYGVTVVRLPNVYGEGGHSCIDKFREGNEIVIFGSGEQLRSYAPVGAVCHALCIAVQCRDHLIVLPGTTETSVNKIAALWPDKKVTHVDPRRFDILDGRQICEQRMASHYN